ncbi:MAG TPA: hypothetical protein VFT57_16385 [Gemmatimonadaceae bacterium]|nr:hypothetical protein [Gemmatimonadaceae bacterium]
MTETAVNTEQVTALFEERERYRAWIAALESKRATTPEHIYNRVHADYTARLQRVVEQFAAHASALQEHEKGLMERLGAIEIEEAKHRDEAAEIELRATVGELSTDTQREVRERTNAALDALNGQREQVNKELGRLRTLLEAGGIPSAAPQPKSPPVSATAAPPPPPAAPVHREQPAAADGSVGAGHTDDWQLAFEKTPEPPRRPTPSAPPAQQGNPDLAVERSPELGPFDDLEFLRSMTDSRSSGENAAVGSGIGSGKLSGAGSGSASNSAHGRSAAPDPGVVHASGDAVSPKESMAAEQVKTLKCQECGTLNYPTEWYCERCGAELAAL